MNRTITTTTQTIWDCKFSRAGHRITGIVNKLQPEPLWVCDREGDRRPTTEQQCERCAHWEEEPITPCP